MEKINNKKTTIRTTQLTTNKQLKQQKSCDHTRQTTILQQYQQATANRKARHKCDYYAATFND